MLEELKEALAKGVVKFCYLKIDGSERVAFGTTNPALIPSYDKDKVNSLVEKTLILVEGVENAITSPEKLKQDADWLSNRVAFVKEELRPLLKEKTSTYTPNDAFCNYYDFDAKGFRKFGIDKLVKVF